MPHSPRLVGMQSTADRRAVPAQYRRELTHRVAVTAMRDDDAAVDGVVFSEDLLDGRAARESLTARHLA